MTDMTAQRYYEVQDHPETGAWRFRVYHYDATGNYGVFLHTSEYAYGSRNEAEDEAIEWCEENGIGDVEKG